MMIWCEGNIAQMFVFVKRKFWNAIAAKCGEEHRSENREKGGKGNFRFQISAHSNRARRIENMRRMSAHTECVRDAQKVCAIRELGIGNGGAVSVRAGEFVAADDEGENSDWHA